MHLLKEQKQGIIKMVREKLIDQLQRFRGVLGKYNCQYNGTKCEFQTNCHRLIEEEIANLDQLKNEKWKVKTT